MHITEPTKTHKIMPLLLLGFRPFFLAGSIFGSLAMLLWLLTLSGELSLAPLNGMYWWHAHEMLFGFVPAIIAGFLLTAVQTWTGLPSINGYKLMCLVGVWALGRILLLINLDISLWLVMGVDVIFLPLVAFYLAKPLLKIKQYRNLIFVPILIIMASANAMTYLPNLGFSSDFLFQGLHSMVLLVTLLIVIIGGRVIPMFTANGLRTTKVLPNRNLEIGAIISLSLIFICIYTNTMQGTLVLGIICLISAILHSWRLLRWRPWSTSGLPLVWILHVSVAFLPIGLLLLSIHYLVNTISISTALHCLTVGVISGMILAMMARVSLGHTGRKLHTKPIMVSAFVAVILAALFRSVFLSAVPSQAMLWWVLSGGLWITAFSLFSIYYWKILLEPRIDER